MSIQIQPTQRKGDIQISTLVRRLERNIIYIPTYQRNCVWAKKKKIDLIDSIFKGLPIPEIFIRVLAKNKQEIVDGQQRTNALKDFYEGKFKYNNFTYDELDDNQKEYFDSYKFSVRYLYNYPEKTICLFFVRLQGGISVNQNEILNSRIDILFFRLFSEYLTEEIVQLECFMKNKRKEIKTELIRAFSMSGLVNYNFDLSDKNLQKYYEELNENEEELIKKIIIFKEKLKTIIKFYKHNLTKLEEFCIKNKDLSFLYFINSQNKERNFYRLIHKYYKNHMINLKDVKYAPTTRPSFYSKKVYEYRNKMVMEKIKESDDLSYNFQEPDLFEDTKEIIEEVIEI